MTFWKSATEITDHVYGVGRDKTQIVSRFKPVPDRHGFYGMFVSHDIIPAHTKKIKKNSVPKTASSTALDPSDIVALNRRAARFQREHELERQRKNGKVYSHSHSDTSAAGNIFKPRSTVEFHNYDDEPENDTV